MVAGLGWVGCLSKVVHGDREEIPDSRDPGATDRPACEMTVGGWGQRDALPN